MNIRTLIALVFLTVLSTAYSAEPGVAAAPPAIASAQPSSAEDPAGGLLKLGAGDTINVRVFGQSDMDGNVYVADDGTIHLPLVGAVPVSGLTPVEASQRVEKALVDGGFLVKPQVTLVIVQSRSQRVSVLGEVRSPGRYPVEANTTVFDLLAQAGGASENSADVVYLLRPDGNGAVARYPINLKGFGDARDALPTQTVRAGDSVFVPRAETFYIYGEVQSPNMYRLEHGMTVVQAIARAGGLTLRGSDRRIEVKRAGKDGAAVVARVKSGDLVQANDVIHVKESIF